MVAELNHAEALTLLPVYIQDVARNRGVRTLSVKGRALAIQGLRRPRFSSDVDIWIDPRAFLDFVAHLKRLRWYDRDAQVFSPLGDSPSVLAMHSITLLHPNWPLSLDLHRTFPGFFGSPQATFDHLWESREVMPIAKRAIVVPGYLDHWLIASLHSVRSHNDDELSQLAEVASYWTEENCKVLFRRAEILQAATPLTHQLRVMGHEPLDSTEFAKLDQWNLLISGEPVQHLVFLDEFRRASSAFLKLQILKRFVFPPAHAFRVFNEVGPGRMHLYSGYFKRAIEGFRRMPALMAGLFAWRKAR